MLRLFAGKHTAVNLAEIARALVEVCQLIHGDMRTATVRDKPPCVTQHRCYTDIQANGKVAY